LTDDRFALALLGTFESLRMGPTFARGRRDERAGHVRQLTVSGSLVVAQVRGPEDARAFRARIAVRAFGAADWARIEQALATQARFAAELLAGRMPTGIGAVFDEAGLSLLPLSLDEVAMDCTCERWPMPCVHLAATTYALVRRFEEDPFGVFMWRGRARDELLTNLRELRSAHAVESTAPALAVPPPAEGVAPGDLGDLAEFWGTAFAASSGTGPSRAGSGGAGSSRAGSGGAGSHGDGSPSGVSGGGDARNGGSSGGDGSGSFGGAVVVSSSDGWSGSALRPDALLDQLDPPPLAQDGRPIVDLLRPAYRAMPED
jgi:uncharacterized Zn finger protein